MRVCLLFVSILGVLFGSQYIFASDSTSALVIFNASILDEEREIKNICLSRKNRCTYLEPLEPFVAIEPGRYSLWNIDFTDNEKTGRGNIHFDEVATFKFKEGRIYLLGHLQLSNRKGGRYTMEFNQDLSLLIRACKNMPESAMKYPLANAKNGKEIDMNCERILSNGT